ncbi:MAG: hypothetical protein CSA64_02200 [Arachnia propionica]|nr:MAG: hypothetical protein CSA64_02200 [Arachnia propionica]
MRIDLNADVGEEVGDDEAIFRVVTSANVCCGAHAGGTEVMLRTCELAAANGVTVGAHPAFADRENFGRIRLDLPAEVVAEQVFDQLQALSEYARQAGTRVAYVKPHGALYHAVGSDAELAHAVAAAIGRWDDATSVLAAPGSQLLVAARAIGLGTWQEGFADRGYEADGGLIPRGQPGALITEPAAAARQALSIADHIDSLCVHGDTPGAVELARAVKDALLRDGWTVRSFA